MTGTLNILHKLNNDVNTLENSYKAALNMCYALRREKAAILKLVKENRLEDIDNLFMPNDVYKNYEDSKNIDKLFENMKIYSFACDWAKVLDFNK